MTHTHASRLANFSTLFAGIALAAAPAFAALGGDYKDGDIYVFSYSLGGGVNNGVLRVDPVSGATQQILGPGLTNLGVQIRFDPYRSKLVLRAQKPTGPVYNTWITLDADGTVAAVPGLSGSISYVAPTGDGRIYGLFNNGTANYPLQWVDAANVKHDVTNSVGAPFNYTPPNSTNIYDMIYEPLTHSIWIAIHMPGSAVGWPFGVVAAVSRIDLDPTGSQVLGPVQSFSLLLPVPVSSIYTPSEFRYGPNGKIMMNVRHSTATNASFTGLIDPLTMAVTGFASLGGAIAINDSTAYSHLLNRAAVLDTFNDQLRLYSQGSVGAFSVLVNGVVSSVGGTSEICMVTEVRLAASGLQAYGAGSSGCQGPQVLGATMTAKVNASDFRLLCTNAPANSLGLTLVTDAPDLLGSDSLGVGILLHVDLFAAGYIDSLDIVSNGFGLGSSPAPIALSPAIVGLTFDAQAIWAWSSCSLPPLNLSSSNGLAITIQP